MVRWGVGAGDREKATGARLAHRWRVKVFTSSGIMGALLGQLPAAMIQDTMEATQVPTDVNRGRNRLAAAVVVGHAIKHMYNGGMRTIIMPQIKIGLDISRAQFGSLATAQSITSVLSTLTAGYLGDRFSHRASVMVGISLGLMGLSLLLAGYASSYWTMFWAMLLVGIGPSLYHPPAIGELSRRFPERRGFVISLHGMGANVGEVLGPVAAAGALTFMIWPSLLKASALPALVAAVSVWALMRAPSGSRKSEVASVREYIGSLTVLLRNRVLLLLVLAAALRGIGESAVSVYVPLYLVDDLEIEPWQVALFLAGAQATGIVSQPVFGYLSDRLGRKAILVPGTASLGVLSFLLAFAAPGPQLYAIIVLKGAFTFSLHHIYIASAIDAARGQVQSTVVSLIYGASFLGTFSPFLAGLIADRYGIHSAFIYGSAPALLATIVLLRLELPKTARQLEAARAQ